MRLVAPAIAAAAVLLALALPAVAHGPAVPATVSILFQAFDPPERRVLAGDSVTWMNTSSREHTVTARNGRFDSGPLPPQRNYAQRFTASGVYPYFCRIHPTMSGTVDVRALLLEGPASAVVSGTQIELPGRAIAGVPSVTVQEDSGGGFRTIATAPVVAGKFHVLVRPRQSASYRAIAGPHASAPVRVVVGNPLALSSRRRGRKSVRLTVKALPPQPGATVVLQTWLKERFGWWPVSHRRLDRGSQARFSFRRRSRGRRVRVLLTEPDGVTHRGVSNTIRIPRLAPKRG